jgi:homoserine kinase type II
MARHTTLSDQDIDVISDNFGLEIIRYQPIDGGAENSSFLLNTRRYDYVLTFYEKKSFAGAEHMVQLLNHLAAHGYHTNQVVPAADGSFVSTYLGKPLTLKTWIPGDTLRETAQKDYRSIGRAIAQLHLIPAPEFLSRVHSYGLEHMPASLDYQADLEYKAWLADMITYLRDHFPAGLPQALIHSDLFDDNIIYHQGQFQAIIDFADACFYPRAYDIGSVLFGACVQAGELDFDRTREVIRGYQEVSALQADERAAIQFFAVYAGAAISAWHYLNTFIRQPADSREDKYKLAAQRTEHIYHIPQAEFNSILE